MISTACPEHGSPDGIRKGLPSRIIEESRMALRLVIGVSPSSGIAEDAVHRLITEGVAPRNIAHRVLKEVGPIPPTLEREIAALELDPLVIGNIREGLAQFIRNGETAVFVEAQTDEEAEFAAATLKHYAPITIEVVPLAERSAKTKP
jgi:hypothetical protein